MVTAGTSSRPYASAVAMAPKIPARVLGFAMPPSDAGTNPPHDAIGRTMSLATDLSPAAEDRPAARHARGLSRPALGAAIAALVAAALLLGFWGRPINHDTAWYLIATRDWLSGARL